MSGRGPLMRQRMGLTTGAKRGGVARVTSVPAPISGLNARDSIAEMAPTDALVLDNFEPGTSNVALRNGSSPWATGIAGDVNALLCYRFATTNKLFAAAGANVYDVSASGPIGAPVLTGMTSDHWRSVNFGTPGGHFLVAVNGSDKGQYYDGTRWHLLEGTGAAIAAITFSGTTATVTTSAAHGLATGDPITVTGAVPAAYNVAGAGVTVISPTVFTYQMASTPASNATTVGSYVRNPAVTGFDTATAISVNAFGQRLWFVVRASFTVAYLPVTQLGGAASFLDLSSLFSRGGSLADMITWTVASSDATTQYAVFVSTEGEFVLFAGYDPSNAATWELAGTGRVGRPIGNRFWERVGTDVVLITADGFVPLSEALQQDRRSKSDAISNKIVNLANQAVASYSANFGWQAVLYPIGNKLIVNVPQNNGKSIQYVMNTVTGAWCSYSGLNALCWEVMRDSIFFGGAGGVWQAAVGNDDSGNAIIGTMVPAFNDFGSKALNKRFTQVRVLVEAPAAFSATLDLLTNFDEMSQVSTPGLIVGNSGAPWNLSPWNTTPWGSSSRVGYAWQWVGGIGFYATTRISSNTKGMAIAIDEISYAYEVGGIY